MRMWKIIYYNTEWSLKKYTWVDKCTTQWTSTWQGGHTEQNTQTMTKLETGTLFRLFNLKPMSPTVGLSGWGRLLDRARKFKWVVQVNWINVWQRNLPIGGVPGFQLPSRRFKQSIRLLWCLHSWYCSIKLGVFLGGVMVVFLQMMWSCYPPQATAFSEHW